MVDPAKRATAKQLLDDPWLAAAKAKADAAVRTNSHIRDSNAGLSAA